MQYQYTPKGVCSRGILIDIDDGDKSTINKIRFVGGCSGNTQGVAALCEGQKIDDVVARLDGIRCGMKGTSCPDQLAKALKAIKEQA
ncbi:MAG: TIGR03905 family TSCPD domain-containing protein [Clostridia bacterium]|nr:TIGR03905 family TSCPD domain-containing protein [Clostridia bacterium]MBR5427312.1 TIGR03905 family TSCPD domain-containing protein [Clostridia bacterium]